MEIPDDAIVEPRANLIGKEVVRLIVSSMSVCYSPAMTYRTFTTLFAVALALLFAPVRANDTDSNVTIKSKDGQVQLVMPDGWVSQPSSNPSAALEARNEDSNAFVMVLVVNRDDPYLPLADYAKERRDEVLSHLVNSKF